MLPGGRGFEAVELRSGHKHGVEPTLCDAERSKVKNGFEPMA